MLKIHTTLTLLSFLVPCIDGFNWRNDRRPNLVGSNPKPSETLPHHSNIYAVALNELQELESEPLCHRVAARLLVNNCQLVDGKDETTILTDSGRQIRDFIDSYAASLAICDLERGSFVIPKECAKFREPSLSQIAMRHDPQLHVSPKEIGLCLSALAANDAAWTTWVSYRHKALHFCEAARADNEKDQNILLYQRLTKVIAKLTDDVDVELQRRMDDLDNRARQSLENLERLKPQVDQLAEGLSKLESYLSGDLDNTMRKSTESVKEGLHSAENLQHLLSVLLTNVLEGNSEVAFAHEKSLQQVSKKVNDGMGAFMAVVGSAVASSASLQQQIQLSNQQAAALSDRQDALEKGMDRILVATETLSSKFDDHSATLTQARNLTNEILDSLEGTASAALSVNQSLFKSATTQSWWPLIVCPMASVYIGSLGLPPSVLRNFGLAALGEVVGIGISSYSRLTVDIFAAYNSASAAHKMASEVITNVTDFASSL
ncbi:nuclear fusion protein KAR5 [Podospora fimiseda]|uniref:Nuclear fusion protein KAR5 n=1 Tax=Podospora fimiseda TaxID=252190 RepID=A0AAN7BZM2_9PEZI|nr:nuclear fusion protein KAR5 [Podospora fimiseda]